MLGTNIKTVRTAQGLSQEELALKLHVVRQTISKWEQGRSVPDSEMLVALAEVLKTSVGILLGEDIPEQQVNELSVLASKLEVINQQLAEQKRARQRLARIVLVGLCIAIAGLYGFFIMLNGEYLGWNYADTELVIMGVGLHALEWLFMRTAPIVLLAALLGLWHIR